MASDDSDFPEPFEDAFQEDDGLAFLRDEGLELLALFRKIRDPEQRNRVKELIRKLAENKTPS